MTVNDIIKHCDFMIKTLNMTTCVECEKEAKDFYKSVKENMEKLKESMEDNK